MDIQTLKLFISVFRKRSFIDVANDFNLAPSSVSRSISLLEDNLGIRLFQRTTRKVLPTEEGQNYYQKIIPILEEWEHVNQEMQENHKGPKGIIRVTCPVSFGHIYLTKMIPRFLKKYPDIEVELLMIDSVVDLLQERIDLAIRFGHLKDSSYISSQLTSLEYIACASPGYLKKNLPLKRPQDINNHNCINFVYPHFNVRWRFRKDSKDTDVPIRSRLRVSSAISLIEFAKKGEGVVLLPKLLIHQELKSGKLINIFPKYQVSASEFGSGVYLVYPSKNYLPSKTRAFIDFMKESFTEEFCC